MYGMHWHRAHTLNTYVGISLCVRDRPPSFSFITNGGLLRNHFLKVVEEEKSMRCRMLRERESATRPMMMRVEWWQCARYGTFFIIFVP